MKDTMKKITRILAFILIASSVSAGTLTLTTTQLQEAAIAARVAKENAARAAKLAEINAQRDAKLPALTAVDAGLAPVTRDDVAAELFRRALAPDVDALKATLDAAKLDAAAAAVDAIKARAHDCAAKAIAAGLDPATVCK